MRRLIVILALVAALATFSVAPALAVPLDSELTAAHEDCAGETRGPDRAGCSDSADDIDDAARQLP